MVNVHYLIYTFLSCIMLNFHELSPLLPSFQLNISNKKRCETYNIYLLHRSSLRNSSNSHVFFFGGCFKNIPSGAHPKAQPAAALQPPLQIQVVEATGARVEVRQIFEERQGHLTTPESAPNVASVAAKKVPGLVNIQKLSNSLLLKMVI